MVYDDIHITAFRGLRDVSLTECRDVNLLVGGNDSGKTSVLEAILLLSDPLLSDHWTAPIELRGTWPLMDRWRLGVRNRKLNAVEWLFPHQDGISSELSLKISSDRPLNGLDATMTRISGEPPDKPVIGDAEVTEGVYRRKSRTTAAEHQSELELDLDLDEELGPERGLELSLDVSWDDPQPSMLEGSKVDKFQLVMWEQGRAGGRPGGFEGVEVPTVFATPISHRSDGYLATRFSRLLREKRKDQALELVQYLDDNIVDLVMVAPEEPDDNIALPRGRDSATLHVEHKSAGLVPIHAMGDGLRRAIHLAALVAEVGEGGVLLIDEIEVAMHTSVLSQVFGWLGKACRASGVQLFATTHSLEAVDTILDAVPDPELALYRIRPGEARRYDGDLLRTARFELGQEVR